MNESSDEAAIVKRANWIGLRTIRQRPKVVDHTKAGEPIFEARSVRLILRGDSAHFNRLVRCVRCSEEVVGYTVRSPADLDRTMNSVICKDCVRSAAVPGHEQPARLVGEPEHHVVAEPPSAAPPADRRGDVRLASVEAHVRAVESQLTRLVEARSQESAGAVAEAKSEIRRLDQANRATAQAQAEVERRLAEMSEQIAALRARMEEALERMAQASTLSAEVDEQRLLALEARVAADVGAPAARLDALETAVDDLRAALTAEAERRAHDTDIVRRSHDALGQRLEEVVHDAQLSTVAELREENEQFRRAQSEKLEQLRQGLAARERSEGELSRTREQLNERIEGLAGWLAQAARADEERASALEAKVAAAIEARLEAREGEQHARRQSALQEMRDALAKNAKELRERLDRVEAVSARLAGSQREGMDALRREMAETKAAVPAESNDGERLSTLEQALAARETEVSDLFDLHAALDGGMGELRSELAGIRSATSSLAGTHADIQERLDDIADASRAQTSTANPTRRRREGRKAEIANETAAALAIEELARHQQRLDSQLARLEETIAGATVAASTHASSQASALGPIRGDIRALHEQLVAQQDVIAALRKSVESLRRKVSVPAPAATKKTARPNT